MDDTRRTVLLPGLLTEETLAETLAAARIRLEPQKHLHLPGEIVLDWGHVRYFQDICLLKLLFLHIHLDRSKCHVTHRGFSTYPGPLRRVVCQLYTLGLLELISSGQMWGLLPTVLDDFKDMLSVDPTGGALPSNQRIMKIVYCHSSGSYSRRSRDIRRIAEFDGFLQRRRFIRDVETKEPEWELISSGQFRHLILEQTRLNVLEHARAPLGLACARIIKKSDLASVWGLDDAQTQDVLALDKPLADSLGQSLAPDPTVLEVVTIDDGHGIPHNLERVFRDLRRTLIGFEDRAFEERFWQHVKGWPSEKDRILSFAFDELGTSKKNRPSEPKGLTVLRDSYVSGHRGCLVLSSDGAKIQFGPKHPKCGNPVSNSLAWCFAGGTAVRILIPLRQAAVPGESQRQHVPRLMPSYGHQLPEHQRVEVAKIFAKSAHASGIASDPVAQTVGEIDSSCNEAIKGGRLLVLDWASFPYDKDALSRLLEELANMLRARMSPDPRLPAVVFVNYPKLLSGFATNAVRRFSDLRIPPICVVLDRSREWLWLGIDDEHGAVRVLSNVPPSKPKLGGLLETPAEAHVRLTFDRILRSTGDLDVLRQSGGDADMAFYTAQMARRCPLFKEQMLRRERPSESAATGRFRPLYSAAVLQAMSYESLTERLREVIGSEPVRFQRAKRRSGRRRKDTYEPIRLPSGKIAYTFYRCDALVDHEIADELAQELVSLAFLMNDASSTGDIDFVVSCTSPTHWFVHKLADGLCEGGIRCGHHVFRTKSTLSREIRGSPIESGSNVLLFTDVISTGELVAHMADELIKAGAHLVGLLALIDVRTREELDRQTSEGNEPISEYFKSRAQVLVREPVLKLPPTHPYKWYVDPETATPKEARLPDAESLEHFKYDNFQGCGDAVHNHIFFSSSRLLLDKLLATGSLRIGHFKHGTHHSEVLCHLRTAFSHEDIRCAIVDAVFRYIVRKNIQLVICPNNSNAYRLRDELALRFDPPEVPGYESPLWQGQASMEDRPHYKLKFATASRIDETATQHAYVATTLNPDYGSVVDRLSDVLILDDGVCTGSTLKSMIEQIVYAFSSCDSHNASKERTDPTRTPTIHVIVFVNRLPRTHTRFWQRLSVQTGGSVRFSSLFTLPCRVYSPAECPVCRDRSRIALLLRDRSISLYEEFFLAKWHQDLRPVEPYERPEIPETSYTADLAPSTIHDLITFLVALDRNHDKLVRDAIACSSSKTKILYTSHRLAHGMGVRDEQDATSLLCELVRTVRKGTANREDRIEVLRLFAREIERHRLSPNSLHKICSTVLAAYAPHITDPYVPGGLATVVQIALSQLDRDWATTSGSNPVSLLRGDLLDSLDTLIEGSSVASHKVLLAWLRSRISVIRWHPLSVGDGVLLMVENNRVVPVYHGSIRHSLHDAIRTILQSRKHGSPSKALTVLAHLITWAADVFRQLFIAAEVVGHNGGLSAQGLSTLLSRSDRVSQLVEIASNLVESVERNTVPSPSDLDRAASLLQFLFVSWFGEPQRLAKLIAPYVVSTKKMFVDVASSLNIGEDALHVPFITSVQEVDVMVDFSQIMQGEELHVICEPSHLREGILQCIDNARKHRSESQNEAPRVVASVCETGKDRVELTFNYWGTRTLHQPPASLYGLEHIRDCIGEFQGRLRVVPSDICDCSVRIDMVKW